MQKRYRQLKTHFNYPKTIAYWNKQPTISLLYTFIMLLFQSYLGCSI